MATKSRRQPALVLDLPGAPNTPHQVPGIRCDLHPTVPATLEQAGISLEEAERMDADPGFPARLIDLADQASPSTPVPADPVEPTADAPAA